jgi:hypothetical protein
LLLVVVLPELVSAQANSLFPDIYIKRKRECCAHEDPRYAMFREQYFGYFPTCWRRFPPGWKCPSPDAPDWEAALRELPLEMPQDTAGEAPVDPFTDPRALPDSALPELPREDGSLFPGTPARPGAEPPPADPAPRTNRPDPFAPLPPGPGADAGPVEPDATEASATVGAELPVLATPSSTPGGAPNLLPPITRGAGTTVPEGTVAPAAGRRGIVSRLLGRMRRR